MRYTFHSLLGLVALLLALATPAGQRSAIAAGERCFPETGNCIAGPIRAYWERNGGLAIFGYPISAQHIETIEGTWTGPVQLFERDRLEDHSNEGVGVLAGRLGAQLLEQQGRPWSKGNEVPQPGRSLCTLFPQTGYNLCPPFSSYWQQHGGLSRFGYPITPAQQENIEGRSYLVQYFERRRMEYHPENAGTPYEILLGLLGREAANGGFPSVPCPAINLALRRTWETYAQDLGCGQPYGDGRIATQPFEGGEMVWVGRSDGGPGQIFVIVGNSNARTSWQLYIDSYVEGEPVGIDELPPPGKFAPLRGFGKLWRSVPEVRQALGWALAPERGDSGTVLQFSGRQGLSWMIHRPASDMVYILRAGHPAGQVSDVARQP